MCYVNLVLSSKILHFRVHVNSSFVVFYQLRMHYTRKKVSNWSGRTSCCFIWPGPGDTNTFLELAPANIVSWKHMLQQIWSYTHWHHQFFICIWGYARGLPLILFSYCATPDHLVAAGSHTLCTGIPAYANRNRILVRLTALFPLLCTTSCNVLFGGIWEMLWIFKVARWKHDRSTKINKSPNVSNGVRKSPHSVCTIYKYRKYAGKTIKVLSCNASKSNLEYTVGKAENCLILWLYSLLFLFCFLWSCTHHLLKWKIRCRRKHTIWGYC